MPVVAASADQLAAMRRDADAFQAYALGPCALAVLRRYAFYEAACSTPLGPALFSPDLLAQNAAADAVAVKFAQAVHGLNDGTLELAHWTADEHGQGDLTIGIVRAGSIPHTLQLWPLVPIIVVGIAAVGLWVVVNAWVSVRQIEAESDALRAKTQAAVSDAVTRVGATDPQGARVLADALARANAAAGNVQPGMLDKLAGAVSDVGGGLRDNATLLLLLGAAWAFSRRRAA